MGTADVKRNLADPWDTWSEGLVRVLTDKTDSVSRQGSVGVDIRFESAPTPVVPVRVGGESMISATLTKTRKLAEASPIGPAKLHVEIKLPAGVEYQAGDYIAVRGENSPELVSRVLKRFRLAGEAVMSIRASGKPFLGPQPQAVAHFLASRVELATPITKRQLAIVASWATEDSADRTRLEAMQDDGELQDGVLNKRHSIIDVLEEVPRLEVPFGVFVDLVLPLAPRQFSISSSPLDPANRAEDGDSIASLTLDVFESPALSGHGTFRGIASCHLASLQPGATISCAVRRTSIPFQLPADPSIPIIMLATGTGIAPMRALVQQRAAIQRYDGKRLGPCLLLFGCRHPDKDFLYRDEMMRWQAAGVVELVPCFSRPADAERGRLVPETMWEMRERLWQWFDGDGAVIFVCGRAAKLGKSAAETWRGIWMEKTGGSEREAHEWFEGWKMKRYISDLF